MLVLYGVVGLVCWVGVVWCVVFVCLVVFSYCLVVF